MKLELKHLAPYLPYKLKIQSGPHEFIMIGLTDDIIFTMGPKLNDYNKDGAQHKPILRPLSDFYKKKGKNGKALADILRAQDPFGDFHLKYDDIKLKNIPSTDYRIIVVLLELHYDIFGLIPEGLAIKK